MFINFVVIVISIFYGFCHYCFFGARSLFKIIKKKIFQKRRVTNSNNNNTLAINIIYDNSTGEMLPFLVLFFLLLFCFYHYCYSNVLINIIYIIFFINLIVIIVFILIISIFFYMNRFQAQKLHSFDFFTSNMASSMYVCWC